MRAIKCCKDCPDRHPACHGSCEQYKKERDEYWREKNGRYQEEHKGYEYDMFLMNQIRKINKKRRK